MRRRVVQFAGVLFAGCVSSACAQPPSPGSAPGGELEYWHVQGNLHVLGGAGGNIAVQIGDDGVVLVDAGLEANADAVLAAVRRLTDKPILAIINTHAHADHTGGNARIAEAGMSYNTSRIAGFQDVSETAADIFAHLNVLNDLSTPTGATAAAPEASWPTDTYYAESFDMFVNGEPILLLHQPAAHTNGDTLVLFRRSDVIATGDIFVPTSYPFIDVERGGSLNGIIDSLNRIIDYTVPQRSQEGGTMVIPGHGRVTDEYEVVLYRDMLTIIRERLKSMIEKGMSLREIKAAQPTLDYDGTYGSDTGAWTTEMFIDAVYAELAP